MKFSKISTAFLFFFTAFIFNSCETEPIDPAVLENISCSAPTAFQSTEFLNNGTVTLSWSSNVESNDFEIEYGFSGFTQGEGTIIESITSSVSITELDITKEYDFYVRSICSNGLISEWVGPINVGEAVVIPQESFFKVDFSGSTYNATATTAVMSGGNIIISGARGTQGENIGIILNGQTVGNYDLENSLLVYNPSATSEYDYSNINPEFESNGSVTITEINTTNNTISGNFSFVGYWSDFDSTTQPPIEFTNGSFTVAYTSVNPVDDNTFFAKLDGIEFAETAIDVAFVESQGVPNYISIVGSKDNDDSIGISINDSLIPGTYPITGTFNDDVVSGRCVLGDVLFNGTEGSITIISKTATTIKGTFSFTVTNFEGTISHQVTEGAFDVQY